MCQNTVHNTAMTKAAQRSDIEFTRQTSKDAVVIWKLRYWKQVDSTLSSIMEHSHHCNIQAYFHHIYYASNWPCLQMYLQIMHIQLCVLFHFLDKRTQTVSLQVTSGENHRSSTMLYNGAMLINMSKYSKQMVWPMHTKTKQKNWWVNFVVSTMLCAMAMAMGVIKHIINSFPLTRIAMI